MLLSGSNSSPYWTHQALKARPPRCSSFVHSGVASVARKLLSLVPPGRRDGLVPHGSSGASGASVVHIWCIYDGAYIYIVRDVIPVHFIALWCFIQYICLFFFLFLLPFSVCRSHPVGSKAIFDGPVEGIRLQQRNCLSQAGMWFSTCLSIENPFDRCFDIKKYSVLG